MRQSTPVQSRVQHWVACAQKCLVTYDVLSRNDRRYASSRLEEINLPSGTGKPEEVISSRLEDCEGQVGNCSENKRPTRSASSYRLHDAERASARVAPD